MNHLDRKKVLRNFQHGFRRNHSCETQLLNTAEELSRRLDMRQTINLLILDFSKAFDTVPHRRLLHKIAALNVISQVCDQSTSVLRSCCSCLWSCLVSMVLYSRQSSAKSLILVCGDILSAMSFT
jgi:hypothetical protein